MITTTQAVAKYAEIVTARKKVFALPLNRNKIKQLEALREKSYPKGGEEPKDVSAEMSAYFDADLTDRTNAYCAAHAVYIENLPLERLRQAAQLDGLILHCLINRLTIYGHDSSSFSRKELAQIIVNRSNREELIDSMIDIPYSGKYGSYYTRYMYNHYKADRVKLESQFLTLERLARAETDIEISNITGFTLTKQTFDALKNGGLLPTHVKDENGNIIDTGVCTQEDQERFLERLKAKSRV